MTYEDVMRESIALNKLEVAYEEIARLRSLLAALFDRGLINRDTVDGDARAVLQRAALEVDFNKALARRGSVGSVDATDLESRLTAREASNDN